MSKDNPDMPERIYAVVDDDYIVESADQDWFIAGSKKEEGDTEYIRADTCIDNDEHEQLKELVRHMWVHAGYENNGYKQMTTAQKELYDQITATQEPEE